MEEFNKIQQTYKIDYILWGNCDLYQKCKTDLIAENQCDRLC